MSIEERIMKNGMELAELGASILDASLKSLSLIDGNEWYWIEIHGEIGINYKDSDAEYRWFKNLTDAVSHCMSLINGYYESVGL